MKRPSKSAFNIYNEVSEYAQEFVGTHNVRLKKLVTDVANIDGSDEAIVDIQIPPDRAVAHGECIVVTVNVMEEDPTPDIVAPEGGIVTIESTIYLVVPHDDLTPIKFEHWCIGYFDKELLEYQRVKAALRGGKIDVILDTLEKKVTVQEDFASDEGC